MDTSKTRDHKDYKIQIECCEFLDNPFRPLNAASVFNEGDSRFTGQLPRRGWVTLEPSAWDKYFSKELSIRSENIEKLEFSSTTTGDVKTPADQVEGRHFLYLGVLNPSVIVDGDKYDLHVRVVESTTQRNSGQPQKLNPSTNEVQTLKGLPIYSTSTVDFGKQESIFLLSDQMLAAIQSGTLVVTQETIQKYGIPAVNLTGVNSMSSEEKLREVFDETRKSI